MDPAVEVALIVGTAGLAGPLLLAILTNGQAEKRDRNARERQEQVARTLVAANERVAASTVQTNEKLDTIHGLVNSTLTASMRAEIDATDREANALRRLIDLNVSIGREPPADAVAALEARIGMLAELRATLRDRLAETL